MYKDKLSNKTILKKLQRQTYKYDVAIKYV